jgi:poly(ADP-ribose) glycohydrolase ARH3
MLPVAPAESLREEVTRSGREAADGRRCKTLSRVCRTRSASGAAKRLVSCDGMLLRMGASSVAMLDRFVGCILGHAIGDAAGAPFEGVPADIVYREFGSIRGLLADENRGETLYYTDDTEMAISVAEVLIEGGAIDPARLARAFGRNYHAGRGYGPGTRAILDAMRDGMDWEQLARETFPGGSLGNGAAMRVAPVGLFFHSDLEALREQARLSALPTHLHPVGIEAAQVMAVAVAEVLQAGAFERGAFFESLRAVVSTDDLRYALRIASRLTPEDSLGTLGPRRGVSGG